jgi:lipid II:glycine glycyltransferase (peptidoglycan interpeptide bridge formation enzyme)
MYNYSMPPLTYKFIESPDNEYFEPSTLAKNVPFTQANFYGNWQKFFNRKIRRFIVSDGEKFIAYFQIIKYPLAFGKFYLYIPYGPVTKDFSLNFLKQLKAELRVIAKQENAVFVRLDFVPTIPNNESKKVIRKLFHKAPRYSYHSSYFQPRAEWFLKLDKSEDELYESMHENNRYSIRLADRKEIKTEVVSSDFMKYLDPFYELMTTTAERNKFALHPRDYYEAIFSNLDNRNSYLTITRYGEKILAIDVIIIYGGVANYVFACSSNEERNRAPSYGAIWTAIKHAKSLGCEYFNFGGITSPEHPNKSWEGLTNFKMKFGGEKIIHSDFYDLVINHFIYHLYNLRKFFRNLY